MRIVAINNFNKHFSRWLAIISLHSVLLLFFLKLQKLLSKQQLNNNWVVFFFYAIYWKVLFINTRCKSRGSLFCLFQNNCKLFASFSILLTQIISFCPKSTKHTRNWIFFCSCATDERARGREKMEIY